MIKIFYKKIKPKSQFINEKHIVHRNLKLYDLWEEFCILRNNTKYKQNFKIQKLINIDKVLTTKYIK